MAAMELSPAQRGAVERSGQDVCTVAGPGSGKTAVLVERFAWLVGRGSDPAAILAITFTDKAATQIKSRLVERFAHDEARRRAVERAPVSTIHSFCRGVLQEHALRAGLDPRFTVMEEREAEVEQAAAMEAVLDRLAGERREEFLAFAGAWHVDDLSRSLREVCEPLRMGGGARRALAALPEYDPRVEADALAAAVREMLDASPAAATDAQRRRVSGALEWLSRRREMTPLAWATEFRIDTRGLKPGHPIYDGRDGAKELALAVRRAAIGAMFAPQREFARDALIAHAEEYARRKQARALVDFEDLQEMTLSLLEGDAGIRGQVQERYEAVLMDELQDTNPVQWRIIDLVRRPGRFFAVGDVNQSIYGFRHAVPGQFLEYQRQVEAAGGETDFLQANYRSREQVLAAVTAITVETPCPGVRPHELSAGRTFPETGEPCVEVQRVEGEGDSAELAGVEALWIAQRLRELHGRLMIGHPARPAGFGDMAVLCRTKAPFDRLEQAFQRFGIPCRMDRGKNFFEEPEILDLTNWLKVMDNPGDEVALFALLRSPFFGVSDDELAALRIRGQRGPEAALERIVRAREYREELPADRILARLMDECGYLDGLPHRARANAEKFLEVLRGLHTAVPGGLAAQIEHIAGLRAAGDEPNAPEVEAGDAVQILTIHSAKGLEFPVVVLAAMQQAPKVFNASIAWTQQAGLGMRWRIPGEAEGIGDPALEAARAMLLERERAEEDRLLYVAMTRAEERLILSWTTNRGRCGPWPLQVETGLDIHWPGETNAPVVDGGIRVTRLEGKPPEETVTVGDAGASPAVEVSKRAEEREPSPTVAVSSLLLFEDCPRKYFLQTILRWPQPARESEPGGAPGGAELGVEVHELLTDQRREGSNEAQVLAGRFQASELGERAAAADRREHEFDFLVQVDGTLLRGSIDLWFEAGGRLVLVDYKTDRTFDEGRLAGYRLQLRLYALALRVALGKLPDEAWLFPLRTGEPVAIGLEAEELERCVEKLRELKTAEARGEYPLREGAQCRWCPYCEGACPAARPD